ncbi:porin family protein [Prevotella intermedia]|uniref:Outer membrane protein beta-barrel domain-containing protein n=1 Tax=Prevotella intermedia TaxID=28131 RepID=A0A2G9IHU4_PREIN|nr:porin family protein [Prevotella intermedia]ATV53323.1 hypothetical protein CTM50_10000 [Prevotella intermedia]PIN29316.1 hypothetical protein CUC04_07935 [Prevotella intermedia]
MKKLLSFAFLTLGLFVSTSVNAQGVKLGVKGGLNVTDMSFDSELLNKSNCVGGFIGPTIKFTLPIIGLGIDASALYDFREAKITDRANQEKSVKQEQLSIPVNARYSIGLGSTASAFLFAGPQWSINIGDKDFEWTKGSSYSFKDSNFSVNAGLGITLMDHLQISANYNIAMGKTADIKAREVLTDLPEKIKSRTNSWQIAVAYFF